MNINHKKALRRRVARLAGQVRGLQTMIEDERDPVEILTQVAAVRAALASLGVAIVSAQMEEALEAFENVTPETQARADKLGAALQRFIG